MAEALYRKYRPQVFEDVVGQEPIERTLKNAIVQDKVSHAYLFCGPRGTGKTTTARLLAKALLCQSGPTPDPDGTCEDCQLIADGVHPDVYELDAASRTGVENVREEIINRVQFAPTRGRSKVYIIDEVHMLSVAAFNALLKTLEEPPSHVVFVLCTTDPQKVPETIHSRCQRFDFRRIAPESMVSRLGAICIAEGVEFEGEALDLIAHRAEGGLRNALTSLEQIIAFENGAVTLAGAERLLGSIDSNDMAEIISFIGGRDIANCFRWTAAYVETGADLAQFVRDMAEHVRNLYVLALVGDDADLDINEMTRHQMSFELQWFGPDRLARLMGVLGDLMIELKTSSNPRLAFEIALTRMVRPDSDLTLESLAERIEALESGYSSVAHVVSGQAVGADAVSSGAVGADLSSADHVSFAAPTTTMHAEADEVAARATSRASASPAVANRLPVAQDDWQSTARSGGRYPTTRQVDSWQAASEPATAQAGAGAEVALQQQVDTRIDSPQTAQQAESVTRTRLDASGPDTASTQFSGMPQVEERPQANGDFVASAHESLSMLANPATLQRIWQAALSNVKKRKQAYGVLFMNTKARYDEVSGSIRVAFPVEAAFAFSAVQKPEVQDALAEALGKAAGGSVPFSFERVGQEASGVQVAQVAQQIRSVQPTKAAQPVQPMRPQEHATPTAHPVEQPSDAVQVRSRWSEQPVAATSKGSERPADRVADVLVGASARGGAYPDAVPYEEVPYEEVPYEEVPYEEMTEGINSYPTAFPDDRPLGGVDGREDGVSPAPYFPQGAAPVQLSQADAATTASPAGPALTPDGALSEDPAGIEALLQAGFGGMVKFNEVEE